MYVTVNYWAANFNNNAQCSGSFSIVQRGYFSKRHYFLLFSYVSHYYDACCLVLYLLAT